MIQIRRIRMLTSPVYDTTSASLRQALPDARESHRSKPLP